MRKTDTRGTTPSTDRIGGVLKGVRPADTKKREEEQCKGLMSTHRAEALIQTGAKLAG
jgi:hypothetical protein